MEWNLTPARPLTGPEHAAGQLSPGEPFLPLSWRIDTALEHPVYQQIELPSARAQWLAFGSVPADFGPQQLADWIRSAQGSQPFLIRGCHPAFLRWLEPSGQNLVLGREALLDLRAGHVSRKSLRELARRGRRHGEIHHWRSPDAPDRVEPFLRRVRSHYRVPLSYLYRDRLPESERFFLLEDDHRVLGLISLIPNGPLSWHTELLNRDPQAPVGVMEALIAHIFGVLAEEGAAYWSLGEVPFYPTTQPRELKALAVIEVGRRLERAYSASGLYRFKAKFNPIWRPSCLFGSPRLSWQTMAAMFWRCNAHKLAALGWLPGHRQP